MIDITLTKLMLNTINDQFYNPFQNEADLRSMCMFSQFDRLLKLHKNQLMFGGLGQISFYTFNWYIPFFKEFF